MAISDTAWPDPVAQTEFPEIGMQKLPSSTRAKSACASDTDAILHSASTLPGCTDAESI